MAEVFSALECYIYRVGSKLGDTTEAAIDAFAEGVSVTLNRELVPRVDTEGVIQSRVSMGKSADMTISKLYSDDPHLFDGNNVKLYMGNSLGTQTYQLTGAYWSSKGWSASGDEAISFDVSVMGRDFGTV